MICNTPAVFTAKAIYKTVIKNNSQTCLNSAASDDEAQYKIRTHNDRVVEWMGALENSSRFKTLRLVFNKHFMF